MASQQEKPKVFEETCYLLKPAEIFLCPCETKQKLENILKELVNCGLIDFSTNQDHKFVFEGRIYKRHDDAEFVIEILKMKDNRNEDECLLEIRRLRGDAFVFHEFKKKVLNKLNGVNQNNQERNKNNALENVFNYGNDQNDENDNDDHIVDDDVNYDALLKNAVNTLNYAEILKDDVISLLNVVENKKKIKCMTKINNVFDELLKPFHCNEENAILDTFVIKTWLQIILLLIEECKSTLWKDKQDNIVLEQLQTSIQTVKTKWSQNVIHPYQIAVFAPSQQIVRIVTSAW